MNRTKLRVSKRLNKRYLNKVRFHNYLKQTLSDLYISI
jgi:hypothetical protein